jgi:hypothetical protein
VVGTFYISLQVGVVPFRAPPGYFDISGFVAYAHFVRLVLVVLFPGVSAVYIFNTNPIASVVHCQSSYSVWYLFTTVFISMLFIIYIWTYDEQLGSIQFTPLIYTKSQLPHFVKQDVLKQMLPGSRVVHEICEKQETLLLMCIVQSEGHMLEPC